MTRRRRTLVVLAALATVATACSRTDEVVSTSDPTTTTIESTSTTAPESNTTVPETTTTVETTTTTVAETTTTVPATTTSEAPAPSTTTPGPVPTPPARAYATLDSDLVEVDVATGAATRTLVEFFNGDGLFRGNLRLSPDGGTIWFSEGYEDGWYGCESSVGSIGRVDVASGAIEIVGPGSWAEPSPDGTRIASITSGLCLPDPENPEMWVLTPYDRVVVRDLASGTEQQIVTSPAPADYASPSQVTWTGFTPDGGLLVATGDGQLRLVDPAGSGVLQDHPVVLTEVRGAPIGATGDALVTVEYGDEGSADLYSVDLSTGTASPLATSEGFLVAGIAANGAIAAAGFATVGIEPGAPVTVLTSPDGGTFYDLDW